MKKKGYDIFDAVQDGFDPVKIIQECKYYERISIDSENNDRSAERRNKKFGNSDKQQKASVGSLGRDEQNGARDGRAIDYVPFAFLGLDETKHFFLPAGSNIVKKITFGSFSKSKLLELAPLDWWMIEFPAKNGFNTDSAIDWVIRESEKKGMYTIDRIRGTGVWEDNGDIIINDGNKIIDKNGNTINASQKNYHYIKSSKRMDNFKGRTATIKESAKLLELFIAQGFESDLEATIAMGWSLIAPFGSVLKWRPHVWITGPSESGKSYVLENLIQPIVGQFVHTGSGKDSAPGIYRNLGSDSCPIIIDEMEAGNNKNNKEVIKKIEDKLELARNASSDFSATITLANQSGGVDKFCLRSCFCFASVVPYLNGKAIESRVNTCRIRNFYLSKNKIEKSKDIIKTGIMNDPGIFRRLIFQNIELIKEKIEPLADIIVSITGNKRKADNLAPIFAAVLASFEALQKFDHKKIKLYIETMLGQQEKTEESTTDEDKLLREIFDYTTRFQGDSISIAELISECEIGYDTPGDKKNILLRHGIKFYANGDGNKYLAIAQSHREISTILENTMYAGKYQEVLKRHEAVKNKSPCLRFAGQCKRAILLNWQVIKNKYFEEQETEETLNELIDVL